MQDNSQRLGRRAFLATLASGAATVLVACASGAPAAPTAAPAAPTAAPSAPTSAAAPTSAPVSAATATPAQQAAGQSAASTIGFGFWEDPVQQKICLAIADGYEKAHAGVKVDRQFGPFGQYWQKIQTQVASGTEPDVYMMSVAYIGDFVAKAVVLELDPLVRAAKVDLGRYWKVDNTTWQFTPGAKMGGQGPLFALSYDASINSTFFYNKTLFDKAKIPYPTADWTWEKDVLSAAKALTDPANGQWGMDAPLEYDGTWTSLVWEWGGDTIDADYTKGTLSEPNALAALTFVYDLVHTHKVAPVPDTTSKIKPFSTGKFGMYFSNCDCNISRFADIKDFQWDVADWPKGPKGRFVEMEPDGYSISKKTKIPDQAFDFLKYTVYDDAGVWQQATYGTLPAVQDVALSEQYLKTPGFPAGRKLQLADIKEGARSNYFGRSWSQWTNKSTTALQEAWLGKKPIADAAKDADAATTEVLKSIGSSLY